MMSSPLPTCPPWMRLSSCACDARERESRGRRARRRGGNSGSTNKLTAFHWRGTASGSVSLSLSLSAPLGTKEKLRQRPNRSNGIGRDNRGTMGSWEEERSWRAFGCHDLPKFGSARRVCLSQQMMFGVFFLHGFCDVIAQTNRHSDAQYLPAAVFATQFLVVGLHAPQNACDCAPVTCSRTCATGFVRVPPLQCPSYFSRVWPLLMLSVLLPLRCSLLAHVGPTGAWAAAAAAQLLRWHALPPSLNFVCAAAAQRIATELVSPVCVWPRISSSALALLWLSAPLSDGEQRCESVRIVTGATWRCGDQRIAR